MRGTEDGNRDLKSLCNCLTRGTRLWERKMNRGRPAVDLTDVGLSGKPLATAPKARERGELTLRNLEIQKVPYTSNLLLPTIPATEPLQVEDAPPTITTS